jgi:hypothetical protein
VSIKISIRLRGLHQGLQLHAVHPRPARSHADIKSLIRTAVDGLEPSIHELVMSRSGVRFPEPAPPRLGRVESLWCECGDSACRGRTVCTSCQAPARQYRETAQRCTAGVHVRPNGSAGRARHYLREHMPAGPTAHTEAQKAMRRLANQVDAWRNPRTNATVDQLLDRHFELAKLK